MQLHVFLFNWPGTKQRAAELEEKIRPHAPVTVLNSDDSLIERHPHWHHMGNDAYFTEQWNKARTLFQGEILFHLQADGWLDDFGPVLGECERSMREQNVGVYAPDVDFTDHVFAPARLKPVSEGLYEVPQTDCTCWAVTADVLARTPSFDPAVNKLGWGIDYVNIAAARLMGRRVVRDYRFKVQHPEGRGYGKQAAALQWHATLPTLQPDLRCESFLLELERERLVRAAAY